MQVYQKLKLVATVQQTQPTIQLLLSTSDFVGALDLIATTQEVLQSELQGVHSLRWDRERSREWGSREVEGGEEAIDLIATGISVRASGSIACDREEAGWEKEEGWKVGRGGRGREACFPLFVHLISTIGNILPW